MKNRLIKLTTTSTPGAPTRGVPYPGISAQSAYCIPVWGSEPVYEDVILHTIDPNTGQPIDIPTKIYKGFQNVLVGETCYPGTDGVSWGVMAGVASATVNQAGGSISAGGGGNIVVTPPPAPPPTPSNPNPSPPPIVIQPPWGGAPIIVSPPPTGGGGDDGPGTVLPDYPGMRFTLQKDAPSQHVAAQATITGPFLGYLYPGDQGLPPAQTDYNLGWNAGGISILGLPADCLYTFTIPQDVVAVVTGLNTGTNPGVDYIEIEHGFFLTGGTYAIVESGAGKSSSTPFDSDDVFAVVRRGQQVSYWVNGFKVYDSTVPSIGSVFVDSSLMSGGDSIVDAHFTAIIPIEFASSSGELHGILRPLVGAAGDLTNTLAGILPGLTTTATGDSSRILNGILPGLVGTIVSVGPNEGFVAGVLRGLVGNIGANGLTVQFAAVNGVLTNIVTVIRGLPGNIGGINGILLDGVRRGMEGFSADNNGAYCEGILAEGMVGVSTDLIYQQGNSAQLVLPSMVMHAHGSTPVVLGPDGEPRIGRGFYGTVPKLTMHGTGGGAAILRLPRLRLAATGTAVTIGVLDARLPTPTLLIEGLYHIAGGTKSPMRLPSLEMIGYGGGGNVWVDSDGKIHGALTFPKLRLVGATGTAIGAGGLDKRLPRLRFVGATGTRTTTAELVAELPMLRFVQSAMVVVTLPRLYMRATGLTPDAENVAITVESEAYSFTLMPQDDGEIGTAATRLTQYPFERIVRYMDRYYGVAVDGIYLLEGDNFAGTPIVATVETGSEDFDRPNLKRLEALWFAGRCGADMNVAAISAEYEEPVYFMSPDKVGARAQRVEFGRGTEARYWAIRFTNIRGEDFQIENAASEITILKRTHGGPS